jgi:hypothetical protein
MQSLYVVSHIHIKGACCASNSLGGASQKMHPFLTGRPCEMATWLRGFIHNREVSRRKVRVVLLTRQMDHTQYL